MEFVTQLWTYKSNQFLLGIHCPELCKNHSWLVLIVLKMFLIGCSAMHQIQPDYFERMFEFDMGLTPHVPMMADNGATFKFRPTCLEDTNLQL